ncbi:ABC transporter permease [Microbacterium resistens]|uniref:ABC transporter permease n=1 Tax=Microbacterium resistens TaxID=156977 RepID=UPI0009FCE5BF|nr:ABC transporter permease [Microbacterium resistens]
MTAVIAARESGRRSLGRPVGAVALVVGKGVFTLALVSALIFLVTQAMPGDVARVILGTEASADQVARLRTQMGLDRPVWEQYLSWIGGVLRGDFGVSLASATQQPVAEILGARLANSLIVAGTALLVMLPVALLLGVLAARYRDSVYDRIFLGASMFANATPEFIIGMVLVAFFSTTVLHLLPAVSIVPPGTTPLDNPIVLILPVATICVTGVAYLGRLVRISFIDVLGSEYIQTARLKGLPGSTVLFRHALPNALAPIIPAVTLVAAAIIGGVVVVEFLFGYTGVGTMLIDAVRTRDVPAIQAVVLVIATAYYVLNTISDTLSRGRRARR